MDGWTNYWSIRDQTCVYYLQWRHVIDKAIDCADLSAVSPIGYVVDSVLLKRRGKHKWNLNQNTQKIFLEDLLENDIWRTEVLRHW